MDEQDITEPDERAPRGRKLPRRAVVAAAAVVALGIAVVGYLHFDREHQLAGARRDAAAAACAYAPVLATYDAAKLDDYVKAVDAGATGEWQRQFDESSKDLREVLAQGKVVSKSSGVQCALKSGDTRSAQALVVIGQTITSLGTNGKPEPGQLSVVLSLENQGGRWLVDKVDAPLPSTP